MAKNHPSLKIQCKECGAVSEFDQYGPLTWVMDSEAVKLFKLYAGELDEPRCKVESCGAKLGCKQSLVAILSEPPELIFSPGDHFKLHQETLWPALLAEWREQNIEQVRTVASHDELRGAVLQRLKSYAQLFLEANQAVDEGGMWEFVKKRWRDFTPEKFVAIFFLAQSGIAQITDLQSNKKDAVQSDLWRRQALSWVALCEAWAKPATAGESFEEDLVRYLSPAAVNQASIAEFIVLVDGLLEDEKQFSLFHFCLEAVRATLLATFAKPNPRVAAWTKMLVAYEMALASPECVDRDNLLKLRISEQRARHTVEYKAVFDALMPFFHDRDHNHAALEQLTTRLGFPEIFRDLTKSTQAKSKSALTLDLLQHILDDLLALYAQDPGDGSEEQYLSLALTQLHQMFDGKIKAEDLVALADYALAKLPQTATVRAEINAGLGSALHELREPEMFLQRIGDTIPLEEENLPQELKIKLWTERGNALRMARHPRRARAVYEKVAELFNGETNTKNARTARRNLAIAYRETGAPDVAMGMLREMLPRTSGEEEVFLLENLAATALTLGNPSEAKRYYERAIELAKGPFEKHRTRFEAAMFAVQAVSESPATVAQQLLQHPLALIDDPLALLHETSAWLNILGNRSIINEEMGARIQALAERLGELSDRVAGTGDIHLYQKIFSGMASLLDLCHSPAAAEAWQALEDYSVEVGLGSVPAALLAIARFAYENGEVEKGHAALAQVPAALTAELSEVQQLDTAVNSLFDLEWHFNRAARAVVEQSKSSFTDVRLVADLRRDAVRRAAASRQFEETVATGGFIAPSDEQLAILADETGFVAVIEWIDLGGSAGMLMTVISDAGRAASHWLQLPEVDLDHLHRRILSRLANWTSGRPGDPFELKEWQAFEAWFAEEVCQHLNGKGHLVIIEHEDLPGFPWHVAAVTRLSCSYTSSWNALLQMRARPQGGAVGAQAIVLGVALVPSYDEDVEILQAMTASAERTKQFAAQRNIRCETARDTECDHARLTELLQQTETLKIICHGFVSADEREVALMIATKDELPLKLAHAAASAEGRRHRFSWRNLNRLECAPRTIFSAACSSARAHIAGAGDRLGLFAPLHEKGTQALIAPGWDVEASAILPILDQVLERYLVEQKNLADILREVCQAAEQQCPRWLAWALTLEGDWK